VEGAREVLERLVVVGGGVEGFVNGSGVAGEV